MLNFTIVWVTSNYSVTKSNITSVKDFDQALAETRREMLENAETDDFWIDDIWCEGEDLICDLNIDWVSILEKGQNINKELFETILNNPEIAIKMKFLNNYGYDIDESNLEDVSVYMAKIDERWVEGNHDIMFPENWLYDEINNNFDLPSFIEENWSYFEEGFARMLSDNDPNGKAIYDKIDDCFVWTYNI